MKNATKPTDVSAHQTVTEFIRLESANETIQIGFTDQKISGRAGLLTFTGFLQWHRFGELLAEVIPAFKQRRRGFLPFEFALSFVTGILAGARKLTHVAHLRTDVMLGRLLAISGIPSQLSFSRFFQRFDSAGQNLATFRPLWRWALERLCSRPGGYALDLDSTRLLHEDGHQEGVAVGYTRLGTKPCLHPLIAVLEEAKLVAGFWLRPGNSSCANNVVAFTLDLLSYQISDQKRAGGKKLIDCPGYLFQALVTNLPPSVRPITVWREYNGRAGCEEVIKQLDADFALPHLCLEKFWSTEAALSLAIVGYNLCVLFQRKLGWLERVTASTLRFRLFTTGGIISNTAGRTTIRLGVPENQRGWWRELLAKLLCEFPNCNSISQAPGS